MNKPLHHGDLDFIPVSKVPKTAKLEASTKEFIAAQGSNSGHAHVLRSDTEFSVYKSKDRTFYDFRKSVDISHEEHLTFTIPAGVYEQKQEQEYDPWAKQSRKVVD